jgi:signal peptide peptidase SppA
VCSSDLEQIYAARQSKPITAVVNHLAASAAYWLASAATEIVVSPSGEVGSIGVFAAHDDVSAAMAREGVARTLISAGKYKTEGHPFGPLTEEARLNIQKRVDEYYAMFVRDVARFRDKPINAIYNGFGEGRVVGATEAVRLGMADSVGTLEMVVSGPSTHPRLVAAMQSVDHDWRYRRDRTQWI